MAIDPATLKAAGIIPSAAVPPARRIDELRSQANALALIERFASGAELSPNGDGRLHGRCPLPTHEDKNPSFGLGADGGYVCACGNGDIFRLYVELQGEHWEDRNLPRYERELREALGLSAPRTNGRVHPKSSPSPAPAQRETKPVPLPSPARGFIPQYVATYEPATEAPPAYHHALSLVLVSLAIGQDAWISLGGRLYLNLYVLLLGASTQDRKSTARRFAHNFWRKASEAHPDLFPDNAFLPTGSTSSEGLLDALGQVDVDRALLSWDEFGSLLRRHAPSYVERLKELMTELYGGWTPGRLTKGSKPIKSHKTYVCAIGITTRTRFEEEITAGDVTSGFLGRWLLIFPPTSEKVLPFPPEPDRDQEAAAIEELAEIARKVRGEITFSEAAKAVISQWYERHRRALRTDRDGDLAAPIFLRMDGTVRKLAALIEAADNPREEPEISEASAQLAIEYADYVLDLIRKRLLDGVLGEMAQKLGRIRAVVAERPGIRRADLMRRSSARDPREFDGLAKLLEDEGEIHSHAGLGRNKRGVAYFPGETDGE